MIYGIKVLDKNGKLKYEISKEACLHEFWKSFGDGVYNEFTGMQVQPEVRAKKYKKLVCVRSGCKTVFQQTSVRNIYCSVTCTRAATAKRQKANRIKNRPKSKCRGCQKPFLPSGSQRYCNAPCKRPAFIKNVVERKKCKYCQAVFRTGITRKVMCTVECGRKMYAETRRLKDLAMEISNE